MQLPRVLGPYVAEHDFSGIVVDGNGSKYKVGDWVWGLNGAGWQTFSFPSQMELKTLVLPR